MFIEHKYLERADQHLLEEGITSKCTSPLITTTTTYVAISLSTNNTSPITSPLTRPMHTSNGQKCHEVNKEQQIQVAM